MADDPTMISTSTSKDSTCNRKIELDGKEYLKQREVDVSSSSMGAPFSTATNCTVEVTSVSKKLV